MVPRKPGVSLPNRRPKSKALSRNRLLATAYFDMVCKCPSTAKAKDSNSKCRIVLSFPIRLTIDHEYNELFDPYGKMAGIASRR
jgi:hypothetical protein